MFMVGSVKAGTADRRRRRLTEIYIVAAGWKLLGGLRETSIYAGMLIESCMKILARQGKFSSVYKSLVFEA
jgi:hypothetical protein